jgi:hypothetical protein
LVIPLALSTVGDQLLWFYRNQPPDQVRCCRFGIGNLRRFQHTPLNLDFDFTSNAYSSNGCNFEFDSNATSGCDLHLDKQGLHVISTDVGNWLVLKPPNVSADSPIPCNRQFDSNVTDASDPQHENQ